MAYQQDERSKPAGGLADFSIRRDSPAADLETNTPDLETNAMVSSDEGGEKGRTAAKASAKAERAVADSKTIADRAGQGPAPRRSALPLLAASIITGAAIAVGGAFGLRYFDGTRSFANDMDQSISALSARIDSVAQKAARTAAADDWRPALTTLASRVGSVETELSNDSRATGSELADLQKSMAAQPAAADWRPALDALASRVAAVENNSRATSSEMADLQKSIAAQPAAEWRPALNALASRIAAVETEARNVAKETSSELADLQKSIAAQPAPQVQPQSEAPDLGPLANKVAMIEEKLASLEAKLPAAAAQMRAQQGSEKAAPAANAQAQAIAIVAESLVDKVERGAPFSSELAELEGLGVSQSATAPLRAFANSGVASAGKLADQFAGVSSAILSSEPPKENEKFLDELARGASSMVHVYRDGEVGKDLNGLVNKIRTELTHNDVEGAFASWSALPGGAKTKSQAWAEAAKARIDALNAARSIANDAVASLGKSRP